MAPRDRGAAHAGAGQVKATPAPCACVPAKNPAGTVRPARRRRTAGTRTELKPELKRPGRRAEARYSVHLERIFRDVLVALMLRLSERLTKSALRLALLSVWLLLLNTDPTGVNVNVPSDGGSEFVASPLIQGCVFDWRW